MHLEGETWHICQRSLAMQIEITEFSVPPRGLFFSLHAVSLRAATTSRDRRSIARPRSPASRARLDEAAHNRTTQRAIGRLYWWRRPALTTNWWRWPEIDGEQNLMEIGTGAKGRTYTMMNWWPTYDELVRWTETNGTGDRYCDRYCERERRTAQLTIGIARLFGAGIDERETTASCLARDRLAARERVPRNKISEKKKMMDLAFYITVGDHPILVLPFSFGGLQFA